MRTYRYYNFLPDALEALEEDDDIVILPPDMDQLTDEEEFKRGTLPNHVAGKIEIMKPRCEDGWDDSENEILSIKCKKMKFSVNPKTLKPKKKHGQLSIQFSKT